MEQTTSLFKWTAQREQTAQLVADDRLTDDKICETVGTTRTTLFRWKNTPEFQARVDAINTSYASTIGRLAITQRARRLTALNDRWRRMQDLIDARATIHAEAGPHGETGLVVEKPGEFGREWAFDSALMSEMRQAEKQAAQEMGQWVEKLAPTNPTGEAAYEPIDLKRLSVDELRALQQLASKAVVASGD